ncbi:MAG: aldo/keto reductase [Chloroflexi bacterium]|nr:aldo/keto reductase [Chloroflexota bacterium]
MSYGSIAGVGDRVSRLILGSLFFSNDDKDLTEDLLDRFVAAGGTTIDTAHGYGRGASERCLGDWLAATGQRAGLTVITKGAHPYPPDEPRRVTPAHIDRDLTDSLARLRITSIDLYLLHRDDESVSVASLIECLTRHVREGRIRAFGASNWSTERTTEANIYATSRGLVGFAASSPNLALAVPREPMWPGCVTIAGDAAALAWHRFHQFPALCWSSQARGFFSGRFAPDQPDDEEMVRVYYTADNWQRLERVRALAARLGCTPTQVALAWVLCQPFPTFALIGPRSRAELDDCLGALDITLAPADLAWLNLEP